MVLSWASSVASPLVVANATVVVDASAVGDGGDAVSVQDCQGLVDLARERGVFLEYKQYLRRAHLYRSMPVSLPASASSVVMA